MDNKKIELSELELKMLKANVNRDFEPMTATDEECVAMNSVLQKADDYVRELDAYDEMGNNLMEWFLHKYEEQQ